MEITVKEVIQRKKELEASILDSLRDFTSTCGVKVKGIEILDTIGVGQSQHFPGVSISVQL